MGSRGRSGSNGLWYCLIICGAIVALAAIGAFAGK